MEAVVDVIIPVYRGIEETRRCLDSVLAAAQRTAFELIVVDDASPEPAIRAQLDELAATGRIHLLRHAHNLGFVAAVNAGIALHPGRDVILLNSDTEVFGDWLDRLCAHAVAEPCVGTVTPFSNDASLCSYPRITTSNPMPRDCTPAALDALAAQVNAGCSIDLPTGVGFCLLIRREALDQVGCFDVERFGAGYGEEVDLCLRLEQAGYRHLLAADVFVYHQGSVSFGPQAAQRKQQAQALIDAEYPDYQERIQAFFANDAGRPLRRRLDIARLRAIQPLILFVCHDRGGGVERHVDDLVKLLGDRAEVLLLKPYSQHLQQLTWSRDGEEFTVYLELARDWAASLALLRALVITRIHYHHVADFPPEVLDLPRDLGLPYDFTLHDFAALCPQFHCADAQGRYCGEHGLSDCHRCLDERPPPWPMDIHQWRARWHDWLSGAERILCPSQDARARLMRYWPELNALYWPHPEPDSAAAWGSTPLTRQAFVKVLVLGAISVIKGLDLLEACARDARERELPLLFRILGQSARPTCEWPESLLSVSGSYRDEHLPDLIAVERPDVLFFPSQVPETFSYTLSVAMRTGLPILATHLGAFSERLAGYPLAWLLNPELPIADWNHAFLSFQPQDATWRSGREAAQAAESYCQEYLVRYFEVFNLRVTCSSQPPSGCFVPSIQQVFVPPEHQPPEPSLSQLYSGVVEYRNWRLQSELTQRIEETELALADAQWERRELRIQLCEAEAYAQAHLGDEQRAHDLHVKHLQAQIDAIHTSTAWRLLKPLMGLVRWHRQWPWRKRLQSVRYPLGFKREQFQRLERSFPILKQPLISIIVAPVEHPSVLIRCLSQLHAGLGNFACEVLVPDTAAGDLAATLRKAGIGGVMGVPAIKPEHFGEQANQVAAQARGHYLLWLDPAIILTQAALEAMLDQIQVSGVGIVVPKIRRSAGALVAAGAILWRDGSVWRDGYDDNPEKSEYNYLRQLDVAPWGGLLLSRYVFISLGGFDQKSTDPYVAAVRLGLKIQQIGKSVLYAPSAVVFWVDHQPGKPDIGRVLLQSQQAAVALDWANVVAHRQLPGHALAQARDPYVVRRVLILCQAPDNADEAQQDEDAWRRFLMAVIVFAWTPDTRISFYMENDILQPDLPLAAPLAGIAGTLERLRPPFVRHSVEALRQRGAQADQVIVVGRACALPEGSQIRRFAPKAEVVFAPGCDESFLQPAFTLKSNFKCEKKAVTGYFPLQLSKLTSADRVLLGQYGDAARLQRFAPYVRVQCLPGI